MRARNEAQPFSALHGRHQGEIIVVLGNSSSLCDMPPGCLDSHITLGVQRILETFIPDYTYVVDARVLLEQAKNLAAASGRTRALLYPTTLSSDGRKAYKGTYLAIPHIRSGVDPLAQKGPIAIGATGNSGYQATQLAYRMGPAVIALAGIDLFWPVGRDTHSFGSGKERRCRLGDVDGLIRDFLHLKQGYAKRDVILTSVSPWKTRFRSAIGYTPIDALAGLLA